MEFQIIQWFSSDEQDFSFDAQEDEQEFIPKKYNIYCFGRNVDGKSVSCKIKNYNPYYYIKVSDNFDNNCLKKMLNFMNKSPICNSHPNKEDKFSNLILNKCCIVEKKDIFGFNGEKIFKFVKLVFKNDHAFIRSKYIFKKPIQILGVDKKLNKYLLYESNFEPFLKFSHENNIKCAGWVKAENYKIENFATTDISLSLNYKDLHPLDINKNAPFVQVSFDIEVYSIDYTFPNPKNLPNEIYQIATTIKKMGANTLDKYLFTLKKIDMPQFKEKNITVYECKDEKDLITNWINLIKDQDPDVLYSYNGDAFDFDYLYKRCELHGKDFLSKYLKTLSRLKTHSCILKQENFSSSAYGDTNFSRLYITGRLNYDLLVHYKRGMKKYDSYKLDYIANEILKEGKHEVSAKEIFKFYEEGDPKKLSIIGHYCIQDTHLLQKLVDKQLILSNIIQMANINHVPIQYITTRGQTIKCTSQIIRKANTMGFVVPHTNFNNEEYFIKITFKKELPNIKEGDYMTIRCENYKYNLFFKVDKIGEKTLEGTTDCDIFENKIIFMTHEHKKYNIDKDVYVSCSDWVEDSFTGATVLEPSLGFYSDNVAILDFASLYPTIIMGFNLCYSTFINDEKYITNDLNIYEMNWQDYIDVKLKHNCEGMYKSGIKKNQICGKQAYLICNDQDGKEHYYCRVHDPMKKDRQEKSCKKQLQHCYKIVQKNLDTETNNGKSRIGVIPFILEELYTERKNVKKLMAIAELEGDVELANIYNATQNAIKLSLNSIYGFFGRTTGSLTLKELGSIVTYLGRTLIETSKNFAENQFMEYINQIENCPMYQL